MTVDPEVYVNKLKKRKLKFVTKQLLKAKALDEAILSLIDKLAELDSDSSKEEESQERIVSKEKNSLW